MSASARTLAIPSAVTWRDVDADLVLFDTRDGRYHTLDRVASRIWRLIARHGAIDPIVFELQHEYAPGAAVDADVRAFVAHAQSLGLIDAT